MCAAVGGTVIIANSTGLIGRYWPHWQVLASAVVLLVPPPPLVKAWSRTKQHVVGDDPLLGLVKPVLQFRCVALVTFLYRLSALWFFGFGVYCWDWKCGEHWTFLYTYNCLLLPQILRIQDSTDGLFIGIQTWAIRYFDYTFDHNKQKVRRAYINTHDTEPTTITKWVAVVAFIAIIYNGWLAI